jgi:organic hydroperoxide reductase OsmC/OhrA
MSEHKATIEWRNDSDTLAYRTYTRDHEWSFHGHRVPASAAPEYLGSETRVNPEEAYVASLSSCHMLTFLAIAAKRMLVVDLYVDNAVGYLQKNENGALAITRVALHPKVSFAEGSTVTRSDLESMHHSAHESCFIANSVKTVVDVEI